MTDAPPKGWTRKPLSEFIVLQRGFDLAKRNRRPGSIKVLSSGEASGWHDEARVSGPGFVVGRATNIGRPTWSDNDYWPLNTVLYAKDFLGNDPKFAYYWFLATDLTAYNSGSVQAMLNRNYIASVPVDVPPIEEQRAIAATLGALDDKIESNRRLLRLLLQRVSAEFDLRFEDRPVEKPLGELTTVVDCLHTKKPTQTEDGPVLMQLNNIRDDGLVDPTPRFAISKDDYAKWSAKFETRPWDLVITNVGRIGAVARIPGGFTSALGRNMTGIRPHHREHDGAFLITALLSPPVRREIGLQTDSGTIMNALNVRSIPNLRVQDATREERQGFSSWATSFLVKADQLLAENSALADTRDGLLPLLLSGRIGVAEVSTEVRVGTRGRNEG